MKRVVVVCVALAAVVGSHAARARAGMLGGGAGIPQPTLLRITGFVGATPAGASTLGRLTLGIDHSVTTLYLTAVQVLNGPLTEGRAALRQFDLYEPNILLVGDAVLLQDISGAPRHTKITLWGYVVPGALRLLVVGVQTGEGADAAATG